MAQDARRVIQCRWNDDKIYPFEVDEVLVTSGEQEEKTRMKDVYLGTFPWEQCPPGAEPKVQYCLKIINTDPDSLAHRQGLVVPSTREQYDLWPFRGSHFRRYVAWNTDAETIRKDLKVSPHCTPLRNCCVVEPVYKMLGSSKAGSGRFNAKIFEAMTCWERLEYMRQIIEALLELQEEKNRVGGRVVLAHRDIKVENALIDRDYTSFCVVLVDMASILFDTDTGRLWETDGVAQVAGGAGPHQTCNGILSSPNNTPPEQVFQDLPQSEKMDVFALGGVLAGLFGSCVDYDRYDNRNPIWKFHEVHGWPHESGNNSPSSSSSAAGAQAVQMRLEDFRQRFEDNLERDRTEPNGGPGWMEQDLADYGITFAWGAEPDAEFEIPDSILNGVRDLFRRCTRIDPRKRPGLRELLSAITELKDSIPESRNYRNERLYLAKELVHLYDLAGTGRNNLNYSIYTKQAAEMSHRAIRCINFNGVGGYNRNVMDECGRVFRSKEGLAAYVQALRATDPSESINVTHALINLYCFYAKHRYSARFDGEIRIFTNGSNMQHFWDDCGNFTAAGVLNDLENLLCVNVKVRVYCPEGSAMPGLPDERFYWQKTSSFRGSSNEAERTATEPEKDPESHRNETPRSRPQPQKEVRVEEAYICGEEGLYFMYNNKKVYVSKRRR